MVHSHANFIDDDKIHNTFQFEFRQTFTFKTLNILVENLTDAWVDSKCAVGIYLEFQKTA